MDPSVKITGGCFGGYENYRGLGA